MKLRNLIFALFLAIGAIGFTACTGDDGEDGAPGTQGEPGEQGEQGEPGDPGAVSGTYDFLKTWGDADGEVTCNDFPIEGTAVFPGGDLELTAIGTAASQERLGIFLIQPL